MTTAIRNWAKCNPLLTALILVALAFVYFAAPALYASPDQLFGHGRQEQGAEEFSEGLWPEIALTSTLILIVVAIGWTRETGLTRLPHLWPTFLTIPYILFVLFLVFISWGLALKSGQEVTFSPEQWRQIGIATVMALVVGLFEELLFRGALLHGLRAHLAAVPAVLVCAALFGAMHFVNWIGGQPFDATLTQVLGAAAGGVCYGAIVLWTGSIWPTVFLHGLWDAAVTMNQTLVLEFAPDEITDVGGNPWSALYSPEMKYGLILLAAWWLRSRWKASNNKHSNP